MERVLVMVRHAKSSWANPLQSDFERPLNHRGEEDAPAMGNRLKDMDVVPDLMVSSTAKRAKQTVKKLAVSLGYSADNIKWEEKLYHCIPSVFEEVIFETADDINTLLIVAHNPGITEFINQLSPDFSLDHMPTCGVVAVRFDARDWSEFSAAKKQVLLFEYPKKQP
jgi:phosphohistidine phosphatase